MPRTTLPENDLFGARNLVKEEEEKTNRFCLSNFEFSRIAVVELSRWVFQVQRHRMRPNSIFGAFGTDGLTVICSGCVDSIVEIVGIRRLSRIRNAPNVSSSPVSSISSSRN